VNKDELIQAIRQSPLSEQDFQEILAALIETMMGQSLVGMGLDLSAGQQASTGVMGRWVPAPECKMLHAENEAGWRHLVSGPNHEHWVEP
jgi:hypothetical protein